MDNRIYLFDFDGVLVNSINETALVAYNTAVGRDAAFCLEDLPSGYLAQFTVNRCRIKHAPHLVKLGQWCIENRSKTPRLLSREEADRLFDEPHEQAKKTEADFFSRRIVLFERDRKAWFDLNPPFQPIWNAVDKDVTELLILTTKNKQAVLDLAAHYGLRLQSEQVFAGDGRMTKEENVKLILKSYPCSKYCFIDDFVGNLFEVRNAFEGQAQLLPLLAAWGYTSPEDMDVARQNGIAIVSQAELIELVGGTVRTNDTRVVA